jgi:dihydropyrimidine dehydrogenase (NADP+)/dihydropyrimidine dehydrogenase (NAD+) subunit PreA
MPTLATTVNGLKLPNPFVIASGPPSTNLNVISHAFQAGWGAVVAKTVCLDAAKIINVTPRYGKLHAADGKEVIGWQNIELISDRPIELWEDEFKRCKDLFPDRILIASVMEEFEQARWHEVVQRVQACGVDALELNLSCPHGLPERKMGAAMGQEPDIVEQVCRWVKAVAKVPFWAKMTPNVTHIEDPSRAALRAGADGIAAINTIRCVVGVNLDTLRPEPNVHGFTTVGGYSSRAVKPIALRMAMEIAQLIRHEFPGRTLSGMGGVESGRDAAEFILLGADTVQVCTGVMKFGHDMVKPMCEELLAFMERHKFETLADFKGKSLDYFTTHAELVRLHHAHHAAQKTAATAKVPGHRDGDWTGDEFVKQSNALV